MEEDGRERERETGRRDARFISKKKAINRVHCVSVCVGVKERERERSLDARRERATEREREKDDVDVACEEAREGERRE